jgi:hypothetical protein
MKPPHPQSIRGRLLATNSKWAYAIRGEVYADIFLVPDAEKEIARLTGELAKVRKHLKEANRVIEMKSAQFTCTVLRGETARQLTQLRNEVQNLRVENAYLRGVKDVGLAQIRASGSVSEPSPAVLTPEKGEKAATALPEANFPDSIHLTTP